MPVVADTNILLRLAQTAHPQYAVTHAAVSAFRARNEVLCITVQNCIEFWAVATRPIRDNGLGMAPASALRELKLIRNAFAVLPEDETTLDVWQSLVARCGVSGKNAHDARLAAVMLQNGVHRILTFNTADFARYEAEGIEAVHPEDAPPLTSSAASQ